MRQPHSGTIRASEIGTFLYCHRAWWYQQAGQHQENEIELLLGTQMHEKHGRAVFSASVVRMLGYAFLLLTLILLTVYLADRVF